MPKIVDDILYIEYSKCIESGISESTLKMASHRNSSSWKMIKDPDDKRVLLIRYEALKPQYKEMIVRNMGNPYKVHENQIFKQYLNTDHQAYEYYLNYRFNENEGLPKKHVEKYTQAASCLNMIKTMLKNGQDTSLFGNRKRFWESVVSYIKNNNIALPANYSRLTQKLKEFAQNDNIIAYDAIISSKFGNNSASKLKDELAEKVLLEMISHPHQFDDTILALHYNKFVQERDIRLKNGDLAMITPGCVRQWRVKRDMDVHQNRYGKKSFDDKYRKHLHRKRPEMPLRLINSDDNILDLYFIAEKNGKKNYYYRPALYVIMDTFNDYILGWAFGDTINTDVVRAAYLNAIHHIQEMTGNYYLWHQIGADHWSRKELFEWYSQQAIFIPTRVGNARAKYIEQSFSTRWHQLLKTYINYAGHNITSNERTNPDAIEGLKKQFPSIDQAYAQISDFINKMRNLPCVRDKNKTRQQNWLENFNHADARKLTDESRFMLFAKRHQFQNRATAAGLEYTLNGVKRSYDIPTHLIGQQFTILYDPYDTKQILAVDKDESIKLLCKSVDFVHASAVEIEHGERLKINEVLNKHTEILNKISEKSNERKELLLRERANAESLLMAGVLIKEDNIEANRLLSGDVDHFVDVNKMIDEHTDDRKITTDIEYWKKQAIENI